MRAFMCKECGEATIHLCPKEKPKIGEMLDALFAKLGFVAEAGYEQSTCYFSKERNEAVHVEITTHGWKSKEVV